MQEHSVAKSEFIRKWLMLAVAALAGAGIYSLPPVIFRGPLFKDILPVEAIFASSLVIHVNLSVLVWMLAIGGMLWSQFYQEKYRIIYKAAFYAATSGMAFIALSPLTGNLNPLKNNYIPVLQNPLFFIGLGLFASGILLQLFTMVISYSSQNTQTDSADNNQQKFGLYMAAIITIIAAVCFVLAAQNPQPFDAANPTIFYEHLFWGGGHILQATYTNLLVVAWFILLFASGHKNPLKPGAIKILFGINLLTMLAAPFFYMNADSTTLFTTHMRMFLGILPAVAGAAVLYSMFKKPERQMEHKSLTAFLCFSLFMFTYGGVLGYMIRDINVTIPAHYHGSIVGISLAFMGLVYHFMPKAGFASPAGFFAKTQPYIYGIGQTMHITGLAVMGGYGALRKDAASSQHIDTILGKTLFFSGGSLAIFGGLVFVVVVFRAMRKGKNQEN